MVVYAIAAAYDFGVAQLAPEKWQLPRVIDVVPGWSWQAWVIVGLAIVLLVIFESAFRRDRNRHPTPSPLEFVCSSYQKTLVGDDLIRGREHLWAMDATLTNTSDTLHVSTNQVRLRVLHRITGDTIRIFVLSLMSDADQKRVGPLNGRILNENEYLGPRDSRTGVYYFLDSDMHGMKPVGINTWPNLFVSDSFGGHYNTNFNASFFATRSESDTEDSQNQETE